MNSLNMALVLDEESLVRSLVSYILQLCNFQVVQAECETEAWNIYQDHQNEISFIFVDSYAHKSEGDDLYHRIRKQDPNAVIVLSSDFVGDRVSVFADDARVFFLVKPFEVADLIQKAQYALLIRGNENSAGSVSH